MDSFGGFTNIFIRKRSHTSSNLYAIMAKALNMASVGPVMVTIRSGQFPSEIFMRALLCRNSLHCFLITMLHLSQKRTVFVTLLTSSRIFFTVSPFCIE